MSPESRGAFDYVRGERLDANSKLLEDRPKYAPWAFWCGAFFVILLSIATFLPAVRNGFVAWDDGENFLNNPYYRGLGAANIRWAFTSMRLGHYIPVTWLTLSLDYVLWGMNPHGYHLTSVLLHGLNALLLYALAFRLLGFALPSRSPAAQREMPTVHRPDWSLLFGAAFAALTFSVHPLRVESVAWITERRDVVAGLFTLLTILLYLSAWARGGEGRLHPKWYWASVGLFAMAVLSKSTVVALPLVLLTLDVFPLRRLSLGESGWSRHLLQALLEKMPFLILSAAITFVMLSSALREKIVTPWAILGLTQRVAISAYSLSFYLWKTMMPWPLSPLYELHYPIALLSPPYLYTAALVAGLTLCCIGARRQWPGALACWLSYVFLMLPVMGLAQNGAQVAADRYSYLGCLPWALLGGAAITWCCRPSRMALDSARRTKLALALAATVIASLAALSVLQERLWGDSETLWRQAVSVDPRSAFAHFRLANALTAAGRAEEARAEYNRALELLPAPLASVGTDFHFNLGVLLQQQGDMAGAERHYRAALRLSDTNVDALNNLGVIQALRGDNGGALESFLRVLRLAPGQPSACVNARQLAARLGVSPVELESCPPPSARSAGQN